MFSQYAIIVSEFNKDITAALKEGCLSELEKHGISQNCITVVDVPGAVEIPLIAKVLAKRKTFSAIICLGAVIRGETSHYDYVCDQVSQGCQRVMLDHDIPVIFGVLTTENEAQAKERTGGNHGHKGRDAANAAIAMVKLMNQFCLASSSSQRA